MTHVLFSRTREWKGKFFVPSNGDGDSDTNDKSLKGINRFLPRNRDNETSNLVLQNNAETEHSFDYSLTPSKLDSQNSLMLRYYNYQSMFSLWKTMEDELRLIEVMVDDIKDKQQSPEKTKVLLGIGKIGMFGGVWNGSPFLLQRV